MEVIDFLGHTEIAAMVKEQSQVNRQKELAGYNLFTISSYTSHLENFHSDVIASILDPEGLHKEGYKFLHFFIDYLINQHQITIKQEDFANTEVLREKGRIDIWIKDETSKQCIIIENKINDATDRDDQLKDYYEYATNCGYTVNVILYLSKDGRKFAPDNGETVNKLTRNIAAFNNSLNDLHTGWLTHCNTYSSNVDSSSLVYQYNKLLSHLGNTTMNNQVKESFYDFININKAFETVKAVNELITFLPDYRADRFSSKTPTYAPFQQKRKYHNNYYLFEYYNRAEDVYKLDVFFQSDGNAYVVLWNTEKRNELGQANVKDLLAMVGLLEYFNAPSRYNGLTAEFKISQEYPTLEAIDNAVLELVNKIFKNLNSLSL